MIEQEKRRQNYYSVDALLKEMGIDNPTGKEALEYILGSHDTISDFIVYRYHKRPQRTLVNRLNMMWVYPLFFITIPIQYIIRGDTGFNRNSKIGKIIDWLVKFE